MSDYVVKPLDASTWDAFARLVERHNGVFGGCWCTWFHTFHAEKTFTAEGNRALKKRLVEEDRAHAALVFDCDEAVAWCQYGPPEELPNIHHRKEYEAALDKPPDYRITCIFVDKKYRRKGVTAAALQGAVDLIAQAGGGVVEGYPHDTDGQKVSVPLQRHTIPVRAGRLQLPPPQGQEELRDAQACRIAIREARGSAVQ
jgi:GNAT superfamily N-acetyltransferase